MPDLKKTWFLHLAEIQISDPKQIKIARSNNDQIARYETDKISTSGSGLLTRSESDPHARSGRLCMLPLALIGLTPG